MAFENESELPSGDNFSVAIILQDGTETDIVCSGMLERQVSGYVNFSSFCDLSAIFAVLLSLTVYMASGVLGSRIASRVLGSLNYHGDGDAGGHAH